MELSVVIPSHNGIEILGRFLPRIVHETERAGGELVLVDDCSTDGTADRIQELFPAVRLEMRRGEPAFCRAVNRGMTAAKGRYLMLLNNDTVPEEGSFSILVRALASSEEDVAAVVPAIPRPDGTDDGAFEWGFRHGLAITGQGIKGQPYPSGACSLWKREVWEELGGMDERYAPIYWEDADLGARMSRAGYRMLRFPEVTVRHLHAATMGDSSSSAVLRERNRFIFMDTHCRSPLRRISTSLWMPFHHLKAHVEGNRSFILGYREFRQWKSRNHSGTEVNI